MKKQTLLVSCLLVAVLVAPFIAMAADIDVEDNAVTKTIDNITSWIVNVSLIIAILMYVIAGYFWVIDNGNLESVKMAKNMILSATIGLAIILIARSLVSIVKTLVVVD
ncbi:MAG: TrbC/VirB2 family protein [Candidatus Pacebacteria bacterium]|nr:TrbC/VirB2 family protein [Candidatus Paceibacterota bacterium]